MLQGHTSSERAASMRLMRQRKMTKEQRRNPRVECTGSAGVLMAAGELPRPAKIVNLSMGAWSGEIKAIRHDHRLSIPTAQRQAEKTT